MVNLAQDLRPISSNTVNLAILLSFAENDVRNGKTISHKDAIRMFEKTLSKKKYRGNTYFQGY